MLKGVAIRAEKFPQLVGYLRKMKQRLKDLYSATAGDEPGFEPIQVTEKGTEAKKLRHALEELSDLSKRFDEVLSEVRLFTTRSDFALPSAVDSFVDRWKRNLNRPFSINKSEFDRFYDFYADDVSYLTASFYGWDTDSVQEDSAHDLYFTRHKTAIEKIMAEKERKGEIQRRGI